MIFGRCGLLLAIASIAAVASAPVEAMTLIVQNGEVLVNRGDGFRPITGSLEIEQGGTVVVQQGAAAEFVCADMSRRVLGPGYHQVPANCGPAAQAQAFELDTAGYLLIGAGVLGGAIAILEGTSSDSNRPASAQ
jgi:hypothetical protein